MSTPPQGPPPQGPPQGPPPQGPPPPGPGAPWPNTPGPSNQYPRQYPQYPGQHYPQNGGWGPGPPGPPYGNGRRPKKSKGWVWMLSGGAFLLVILVVGAFIGLNALSKNSGMSHDVVSMDDGHDDPPAAGHPSRSPSENPSPSESPSPSDSTDGAESDDYGTGSCIVGNSTNVIEVDCSAAHLAQIYYEEELPDSSYPDKAALKAAAERICPKHVKGAVDSGTVTSKYRISWLAPTAPNGKPTAIITFTAS